MDKDNIKVMLSSGDVDEWEDTSLYADMDLDMGGALIIRQGNGKEGRVQAIYAPGMWMKVEFDQ